MSSDSTQHFYDEQVEEYFQQTKDLQPTAFLKRFMKLLPQGATILDLGCAFGRDCKTFLEEGFTVTGMDYSESMIKRAKTYAPKGAYMVADMKTMELPPEHFDGIWAYTSLLHVQKDELPIVMGKLHRSLKVNGVIAIGVKEGKGEGYEKDTRYQNDHEKFYAYFTEEEVRTLLESADFSIKEIKVRTIDNTYQDRKMIEVIAKKIGL